MTASPDVLIAGAGIVGTACAWELAKAGLQVAVIDQAFPAAGATGASMGHIVVMDDSEAQFALTRFSQQLWDELRDEFPASQIVMSLATIARACPLFLAQLS